MTYDELGRVKTVTHPPNTGTSGNSGVTTYVYGLNTVKVTDPAGRWKKYEMDGFGNLVKVTEPKPVSGEYETTYVYSALNELKTVTMTRDGYTAGDSGDDHTDAAVYVLGREIAIDAVAGSAGDDDVCL